MNVYIVLEPLAKEEGLHTTFICKLEKKKKENHENMLLATTSTRAPQMRYWKTKKSHKMV